jgi:hypothetical protein
MLHLYVGISLEKNTSLLWEDDKPNEEFSEQRRCNWNPSDDEATLAKKNNTNAGYRTQAYCHGSWHRTSLPPNADGVRMMNSSRCRYKAQNVMQCYNCRRFSHVWANCMHPPCCLCGGNHLHKGYPEKQNPSLTPTCFNCQLAEGDSTSLQLLGLQACEGVPENAQDYNLKDVLLKLYHLSCPSQLQSKRSDNIYTWMQ